MKYALKKCSLCSNLLKIKKGPPELQQTFLTSIRQKGGTQRALAYCVLVLNLVFEVRHYWSKSFFRTLVSSRAPRSSRSFSSLHFHLLALLLLLHLSHHYPVSSFSILSPLSPFLLSSQWPIKTIRAYQSLEERQESILVMHVPGHLEGFICSEQFKHFWRVLLTPGNKL